LWFLQEEKRISHKGMMAPSKMMNGFEWLSVTGIKKLN
jgi:hypothetical protein